MGSCDENHPHPRSRCADPLATMRNAFISFSTMTISVVAVETDVVRGGRPVIGYGFTSNGRYAQGGIMRERLGAAHLETDPAKLMDDAAGKLDPQAVWPP